MRTVRKRAIRCTASIALSVLLTSPPVFSDVSPPASEPSKPPLTQEELDQVAAPIALYPDSLLTQVLMASTYPLEVVEAERWTEQNKSLTGDALVSELEKQSWDPSVKSLINFPQTLDMMNTKLDWTIKLGDAFIGQQQQVMDAIQNLREKAQTQGNLKTNDQQKVTTEAAPSGESQVIVIEPANPQVIYVPTYDPVVVYGPWPYPSYPPYYYYPPGYVAGATAVSFGVGLAVGMAWGYAWGHCGWNHGSININVNQNININTHINRNYYQNQINRTDVHTNLGQTSWEHDPSHRDSVAYRDNTTAQRNGMGSSSQAEQARDAFRGRDQAPQNTSNVPVRSSPGAQRPSTSGMHSSAFNDVDRGSDARNFSQRRQASRSTSGGGFHGGGGSRAGGRR